MGSDDRQAAPGQAQVRELIGRIDAHRQAAKAQAPAAHSFRWETDGRGTILWVEGAPRSALIGQGIASAAVQGRIGADAGAAGAFRRRAPFRDQRFTVAGEGAASGEWRLSGVPFFDPHQGHFLGYRGSARRPFADEAEAAEAKAERPGLFGSAFGPDSLRQLVHELRTPLNAIMGFAEMIDGQYLGPAPEGYRARSSRIREQAQHLLSAVEDVDAAARIDTGRLPAAEQGAVDLVALLYRLHEGLSGVARCGEPALRMEFAPDLPLAKVEAASAERMLSRLLTATVGFAEQGEILEASITGGKEMLRIAIARPRSMKGLEEARLLDPGFSPPGYWPAAPALGLGFALRLVRSLAEGAGGSLEIESERFALALPALEPGVPR